MTSSSNHNTDLSLFSVNQTAGEMLEDTSSMNLLALLPFQAESCQKVAMRNDSLDKEDSKMPSSPHAPLPDNSLKKETIWSDWLVSYNDADLADQQRD